VNSNVAEVRKRLQGDWAGILSHRTHIGKKFLDPGRMLVAAQQLLEIRFCVASRNARGPTRRVTNRTILRRLQHHTPEKLHPHRGNIGERLADEGDNGGPEVGMAMNARWCVYSPLHAGEETCEQAVPRGIRGHVDNDVF
jgi:hypothetical protein